MPERHANGAAPPGRPAPAGPVITGRTRLIAHFGWPTATFKAPLIYNPFFAARAIDVVVVPMGVKAEGFSDVLAALFRLETIVGALVTMPHKATVPGLVDRVSTAARIAGSANAVKRDAEGRLVADMFDGEGFVRGLRRNGQEIGGRRALVVGAGGVGSAIAAALAGAGVGALALFDANPASAATLAARLAEAYPAIDLTIGSRDPAGFDIVVNATPLGMNADDPLPLDVDRLSPSTFVGEVVLRDTPLLAAARARGCRVQVGVDMLFEQIPAYLEFFGLPTATPAELRRHAALGDQSSG